MFWIKSDIQSQCSGYISQLNTLDIQKNINMCHAKNECWWTYCQNIKKSMEQNQESTNP